MDQPPLSMFVCCCDDCSMTNESLRAVVAHRVNMPLDRQEALMWRRGLEGTRVYFRGGHIHRWFRTSHPAAYHISMWHYYVPVTGDNDAVAGAAQALATQRLVNLSPEEVAAGQASAGPSGPLPNPRRADDGPQPQTQENSPPSSENDNSDPTFSLEDPHPTVTARAIAAATAAFHMGQHHGLPLRELCRIYMRVALAFLPDATDDTRPRVTIINWRHEDPDNEPNVAPGPPAQE